MKSAIMLDELQINTITRLAKEKRRVLGFVGETPIAGDIFTILERMNICRSTRCFTRPKAV